MSIHLAGLVVYPIKSTHRIELQESAVERRGLRGDRRWMVVDENGLFYTQREQPRLAMVQAAIREEGLSISAPGMETIHVPLPDHDGTTTRVRVFSDTVAAAESSRPAREWFTEYLGRPARLVYMREDDVRKVDAGYATAADDHVSFADGYPLLLTSTASLADLNSRLDIPVSMNRFRPNVVVTGAEPFAEDTWREIRIGDIRFHVVKGCARCVITTVDQDTAEQGKEPLRTLNRFRKRDGNVYFGQNLIPASEGRVRVGDAVEVIRTEERS